MCVKQCYQPLSVCISYLTVINPFHSTETRHDAARRRPPRVRGHNLVPHLAEHTGVVSIVDGHLNNATVLTSDHIKVVVILGVKIFASHQSAHTGIIVNLLQSHSVLVVLVAQRDNIISGTTLVFLGSAINLGLDGNASLLLFLLMLHMVPPVEVPLEALLPECVD